MMQASRTLDRRTFLRGAGVAMALPALEAMGARSASRADAPMRLMVVANPLGMLPEAFFPEKAGPRFALPELLRPLAVHRKHFTVFSHLDHGITGGHSSVHSFLSGILRKEARAWPHQNISVDQRAAEHVGAATRFGSLVVAAGKPSALPCKLSWTRNGVNVPPVTSVKALFRALFVDEPRNVRRRQKEGVEKTSSVLDAVREQAGQLKRRLGKADRDKLEEYFTSVGEVETRLSIAAQWADRPKPKVEVEEPFDGSITQQVPLFFDLLALALQTDSTRIATFEIPGTFDATSLGLNNHYHGFSHHGYSPQLKEGLLAIERFQTVQLSRFLKTLASKREPDGRALLDRTMVLFGSGMGNGNAHTNKNLPLLLAGGGFRHGEHRIYPEKPGRRVPLCNLFVTLLQRFGLEIDRFNTSTGSLTGLEVAR